MGDISKNYGGDQNIGLFSRAPVAADKRFPVGYLWIDTSVSPRKSYVLLGIVGGLGQWSTGGGGSGTGSGLSEYLPGTTYLSGDIVNYLGTLYKCIAVSSIGEQPDLFPAVWELYNSKVSFTSITDPSKGVSATMLLPIKTHIDSVAHGLIAGTKIRFVGGDLPAPLAELTDYTVCLAPGADWFEVETIALTPIQLTTAGSGDYMVIQEGPCTMTGATDLVNSVAHPLLDGDIVQFTGVDLPVELALLTDYYVINKNADDFQIALVAGGVPIEFSDSGAGLDVAFHQKTSTPIAFSTTLVNSKIHKVATTMINNDTVQFTGLLLPPELVVGTTYYVVNKAADDFEVAPVLGGVAIDFSVAGSGKYHLMNQALTTAILDAYDGIIITLTEVPAVAQTLQTPTAPNKVFIVINSKASSESISVFDDLNEIIIEPGSGVKYFWDGSFWNVLEGIDANDVTFTPYGFITSADVQKAIEAVVDELAVKQDELKNVTSVGIGREPVSNMVEVSAEDTEDTNYVAIVSETDRTRGFSIDDANGYKWAGYVYEEEDGDTLYLASGNSQRDVLCLQSGGRVGINVPTLLVDVQILRIVQSGGNTYATVTTETPHRLPNNTPIKIVGATNAKFNGEFTITNVTTNGFRISGLEVGAVTEDPSDAEIVMTTNIPGAFAVFPQCFDAVYSFDKALDTGVGTGFVNLTSNMKTSFGTPDTILPLTTGSYLYLGKFYPWRATNLDITTPSAGSSAIVVEYYNTSGGWTALTTSPTSGNSLVDSTNRLRNDGIISWNIMSFKHLWGHTPMVVNPTPKSTQDLYWIRISLTGTITTAPTSKSIGNHGVDRLAVFAQSGDVNPFFSVDQYGRVGITPAELEAKYSIGSLVGLTTSKFEIVSEDGYKSDFVYYLANSSSDMHPAVVMARSGGTIASKSAVINGMDLGAIYGFAYDGSQFREVAGVKFESASAGSAGNVAGRVVFFTRPGATASVEVARITEAGLMGIGTVTPRSKLDVNGGVKIADDTDAAGVNKVGTVRYRVADSIGYFEVCRQTGASAYAWEGVGNIILEEDIIPIDFMEDGTIAPDVSELYTNGNAKMRVRKFSGVANQDLYFNWPVPEKIDASVGIKFAVEFVISEGTGPNAEKVSFTLAGYSVGNGDNTTSAFGGAIASNLGATTANQHSRFLTAKSAAITLTDLAVSELAFMNLIRDAVGAEDTYAQKVAVIGIRIYWSKLKS